MKKIIRRFIFTNLILFCLVWFMPNVTFGYPVWANFQWSIFYNFIPTILFASLIFTILHSIVKPILKLFAFPFNFLTFGLLYFFIDVLIFWLLIYFVPTLQITPLSAFGYDFNYLTSFLITVTAFNIAQNIIFAIF
jgi:uncharacterized membrane protein YvlD (DUF360 family)